MNTPKTHPLRTILYIRVSSERQKTGASIPNQLAHLRAEAKAAGELIVEELIDQARSGTDAKKRPAYQRLLKLARTGMVDRIRFESVDRGHRNERERREFEFEMVQLGVQVIYSGEPDVQAPQFREFNRDIRGAFAQLEAGEASQRTYKRLKYGAEKGRWRGGIIPYGLQRDGKGWFMPDPTTYPVLIWILERRAEGLSPYAIARLLNQGVSFDGKDAEVPLTPGMVQYQRRPFVETQDPETGDIIRTPRMIPDGHWKPATIRHICQEATNGVYAGILQWGMTHKKYAEDAEGRPKQAVIVDTGTPLVDADLLQRVRAVELQIQDEHLITPNAKNLFLLSHLLRCGICDKAMHGYTTSKYKDERCYKYRKYRCAGRSNKPGACSMTILSADALEKVIVQAVFSEVSQRSPDNLIKGLTVAVARRRQEINKAMEILATQRRNLEQRRDSTLDALMDANDLSAAVRKALTERTEAAIQELDMLQGQHLTLQTGLDILDSQARTVHAIIANPNLDPNRWHEPRVTVALQRALHVLVRRIEVHRQSRGLYTIKIWLVKAENLLFSELDPSESAWESNPSTKLVTPPTSFEDQDSHRAICALTRNCR